MNLNPDQAAQTASYAGQAMNMFQTAVTIDNQQPQPEGTTFWFRWLIRIVAIVTGIRNYSSKILLENIFFIIVVAMICGVFAAISISPICIAAGAIMMLVKINFLVIY